MKINNRVYNIPLLDSITQELPYHRQQTNTQLQYIHGIQDYIQIHNQATDKKKYIFVNQYSIEYANRLRKNIRKLDKWARLQGIECYRIYDRDLPDYKVAVDRYADWIVIHDYESPITIHECTKLQRLLEIISTTLEILQQPANKVVLKTRKKQKGKTQQYQKIDTNGDFFAVTEFNAKLLVNLTDYIDTGLFLDHRITRKILGKLSREKDFLNLFGYTGSASVHAGLGGALSTTTVDMSRTYLSWAEQNMRLNGLSGNQHLLVKANCFHWIRSAKETFDIIFVNPPTFSNSKKMSRSFDIQRDYLELLWHLKSLLRIHGKIIFSNNKHGFKMNLSGLKEIGMRAVEITAKTQPKDFYHTRSIHKCWIITHANNANNANNANKNYRFS
ncbi:Ribosomal RNA large subunit methyltransferase K/L [Candidatus Erwinia haradaeae]|uniref:Ribosomal RNA large subunit methyltransferase K/L, partial n=1 Tax=Candidatus Erwinia haradaeae TaxID=1922217 RepID=A0A451DJV5_9GAMM|nr:bifunctional 23S rRNA (guanine(2069)-N(7))-methyltransferase RlmK/23S rRNA (guanine(2445)-N(2))-methyltransferase RlmL [Candidatus Erwinia haradaeae]VFP86970.1 Ribosomal RNA large subunit methyltransferase K/L [Candidatus Erwinia haradaeae]